MEMLWRPDGDQIEATAIRVVVAVTFGRQPVSR
jgi:hypothetical protein